MELTWAVTEWWITRSGFHLGHRPVQRAWCRGGLADLGR